MRAPRNTVEALEGNNLAAYLWALKPKEAVDHVEIRSRAPRNTAEALGGHNLAVYLWAREAKDAG